MPPPHAFCRISTHGELVHMMCGGSIMVIRTWSEPLWDKQVIKPVYREALDKWKGNIPRETLEELSNNDMKLAAALRHFGYDPLI